MTFIITDFGLVSQLPEYIQLELITVRDDKQEKCVLRYLNSVLIRFLSFT